MTSENECRLDYDGFGEAVAIEAGEDPQSLWVRVGPVWDGDHIRDEPGVWISWQDRHMASSMGGPVLLTPEVWRKLAKIVEQRLSGDR